MWWEDVEKGAAMLGAAETELSLSEAGVAASRRTISTPSPPALLRPRPKAQLPLRGCWRCCCLAEMLTPTSAAFSAPESLAPSPVLGHKPEAHGTARISTCKWATSQRRPAPHE